MDPYIEEPELWRTFHLGLMVAISGLLQPQLKPMRVAMVGQRPSTSGSDDDGNWRFVIVTEPPKAKRPITVIELLDPESKTLGDGRTAYIRHREHLLTTSANVVEIDLLRSGVSPLAATPNDFRKLGVKHSDYIAVVTRVPAVQHEVYPFTVRDSLPILSIPTSKDVGADVRLDLQQAFNRCWEGGPYPELLDYDAPPPGPMAPADVAWCEQRLREKGLR
jgi:hypothetical protein